MRRTWWSAFVVALLLGAGAVGPVLADSPATTKPVAVMSFSGYNELKGDIAYVGRLAGNPNLAIGLEVVLQLTLKNQPLTGLDKERPWGAVILLDEAKLAQGSLQPEQLLSGYAFVPVKDLKALLQVFKPFVKSVTDLGSGVYEVVNQQGKSSFVKQVGGWAFFADRADRLTSTPENPQGLLTGLSGVYDLAVRFNVSNVPVELRNLVAAGIKAKAEADLTKRDSESDDEYAVRKILSERLIRGITTSLNEIEQLTVGWALDPKTEKTYLDVDVTALPGTKTAREFAGLSQSKSEFAGFLLPGALLAGNWSGNASTADAAEMVSIAELARKKALSDIDKQNETAEKTAAGKKLVNGLFDVVKSTLATGRSDGGVAAIVDSDVVNLALGGFIADGARLEATFKDLVDAVKADQPGLVEQFVKLNAGEHKGVKFHTISFPTPQDGSENSEKLVKAVGDEVKIALGVGAKSVYLAAGRDPVGTITKVIDRSAEAASKVAAPMRMSLDLEKLAKFVAAVGKEDDKPKAALAVKLLAKSAGQDHVNLVANSIDRGLQLRLEVEPGLLKAIGAAASPQTDEK